MHDLSWSQGGSIGVLKVTGAQFAMKGRWPRKVLHLHLLYGHILKCSIRKTKWALAPETSRKSSFLTNLSTIFTFKWGKHISLICASVSWIEELSIHNSISYFCTKFGIYLALVWVIADYLLMAPHIYCITLNLIIFWRFYWPMNVDLHICICMFCNARDYVISTGLHQSYDDGDRLMIEHVQLIVGWGSVIIRAFIRCQEVVLWYKDEENWMIRLIPLLNGDNSNSVLCYFSPASQILATIGSDDCPWFGLRADIDVLPNKKSEEWEHKSKIDGKKHAGGHDARVTMFLGAAPGFYLNPSDIKTTNFSTCELERILGGYWCPGTERAMFFRVDKLESDVKNITNMNSLTQTIFPVKISLPQPLEESRTTTGNIVIIRTLLVAKLINGAFYFWTFLKKYIKYGDMARTFELEIMPAGGFKGLSYSKFKDSTNNFSNPIGKGGFGIVYVGKMNDERVMAAKSLKSVTGGDADFWAEVNIIARMHHLNLVRLWGFCAGKSSRHLVYEDVLNGSLDVFLWGFCAGKSSRHLVYEDVLNGSLDVFLIQSFEDDALEIEQDTMLIKGSKNKPLLDWNIKLEYILLRENFCPKVSEFERAKLKKKVDMISMSRIHGTPGYMAPEWTQPNQITCKVEVFHLLQVLFGNHHLEDKVVLKALGMIRPNKIQIQLIPNMDSKQQPTKEDPNVDLDP